MSAKRRRKNSAHNWRWLLRPMLSHDEAHDTQKSIVDAHEYDETRETRRNTHIQNTVNVQTHKHGSIAYTRRRNKTKCQHSCVYTRTLFLCQKNNSRFHPNPLDSVEFSFLSLSQSSKMYPVRVSHIKQ